MRILAGAIAGATALAAIGAIPQAALAAPPPRVAGQDCSVLASGGANHLWRATYWAAKENIFGQRESFMLAPCFTTKSACEAWFYWAQTDWPDQIATERCRRL